MINRLIVAQPVAGNSAFSAGLATVFIKAENAPPSPQTIAPKIAEALDRLPNEVMIEEILPVMPLMILLTLGSAALKADVNPLVNPPTKPVNDSTPAVNAPVTAPVMLFIAVKVGANTPFSVPSIRGP